MGSNLKVSVGPASLEAASGAASNSGTGSKGSLRFRVHTLAAEKLMHDALGQHAFRLTFASLVIEGVTVAGIGGKPDEDGLGKSSVTFAVPQASVRVLGAFMSVLGQIGDLQLDEDQMAIDLTARA